MDILRRWQLLCVVFICLLPLGILAAHKVRTRYEPNWNSLDKRPLPAWYDEAKVGIFLHWGVYSVPSMGSEWFWTNWRNKKDPMYVDFMKRNYKPHFTYQEFAKDFTAELFNATKWTQLFAASGAKYVVLTSKHHDGYTLWPSTQSFGWNAMDVGPHRDIIMELSTAIRQNSKLKFGLYYSLFEWFNPMYIDDKYHIFLRQNYVERKVHPEQMELVTTYKPEIIWSDGDWDAPPKYWKSEEFIAWLYNDSPVRDTVVVNDRWGFGTSCKHGDFYNCEDRFNPGVLQTHKWENAFTLDKFSWGQRFDITLDQIMTAKELITEIITTVSCNGNVLINVGPTKYGTILPIYEERLREMGLWLHNNGEAIYATKPWIFQNDTITPNVWYTGKVDNHTGAISVYAIVVSYPFDTNSLTLHPFGGEMYRQNQLALNFDSDWQYQVDDIVMLGMTETKITFDVSSKGAVYIEFPPKHHIDKHKLHHAWTFKMSISNVDP